MAEQYPHSLAQALADVTRTLRDTPEELAWNKITELMLGGAMIAGEEHSDLSIRGLARLADRVQAGALVEHDARDAARVIRSFAAVRCHSRTNERQKLRFMRERGMWRARATEAEAMLAHLDPTGALRKPGTEPTRNEEQTNEEARTYGHPQAD